MNAYWPHVSLASIGILLISLPELNAQATKGTRERFVVQALEDFARSLPPSDPQLLEDFVASQRLKADVLRRFVASQKMRDQRFVERIDEYDRFLQNASVLLKSLYAIRVAEFSPVLEERAKLRFETAYQNSLVARQGVGLFLNLLNDQASAEQLGRGFEGIVRQSIYSQNAIEEQRRVAIKAFYDAKERIREKCLELCQTETPKLEATLKSSRPLTADELTEMGTLYGWSEAVTFDPKKEVTDWKQGDRPKNPFWIQRVVIARKPGGGIGAIDDYARCADDLLAAARLVPIGKEYNVFRKQFYVGALIYANKSSAAEIGSLALTKPTMASKKGLAAQQGFLINCDSVVAPIDGEDQHQILLALAYGDAKQRQLAYANVKKVMQTTGVQYVPTQKGFSRPVVKIAYNPARGTHREFWYTAARLCALHNDTAGAWVSLRAAIGAGFSDIGALTIQPEFESLRSASPTQFAALVESIRQIESVRIPAKN